MASQGTSNRKQTKYVLLQPVICKPNGLPPFTTTIISVLDAKGKYLVAGYGPRVTEAELEAL